MQGSSPARRRSLSEYFSTASEAALTKAERFGSSSGWASEKIRVSASECIGGRDSDAGWLTNR